MADDRIPFLKGILEPFARVVYLPGQHISNMDIRKADGLLVRTRTLCNRELLEGSSVRFIATATIGYDHIDTEYCDRQGICWHHAAGCNASAVDQYVTSALLRLVASHGFGLRRKVIGIVGAGHAGSRIAASAYQLGMEVLLNDPPRERAEGPGLFSPLELLQKESDIISFHVPLTMTGPDRTYHLAGRNFFSPLRKKPFIINTARGGVVDEEHLKDHLAAGLLSGAVLDVWENEPWPDPELMRLAEIVTPHIAGYSTEGKANGTAMVVRQASSFFSFGLDDWYPDPLPAAPVSQISIANQGLKPSDILGAAVKQAYDIMADDRALREHPGNFEQIRNEYPVRREFPAFTVRLLSPDPESERMLSDFGFQVMVS